MFVQFMIDKKVNQTRNIYDIYIYRSDTDTKAEIEAAGYFAESRFVGDDGWDGGKIEIKAADGYMEGFVDAATGTFTASLSS